jgi:hypothetical protein
MTDRPSITAATAGSGASPMPTKTAALISGRTVLYQASELGLALLGAGS